jgi:hypothetical protein
MKTILILAALLVPTLSSACPLGPGETELSLARVMRNFGRYLMPADRIVQKATMGGGQDIPNPELESAIQSLAVVMNCVDVTLADRTDKLWPRKARELSGDERAAYLRRYAIALRAFRVEVEDYSAELTRLLQLPVPGRDFTPAKALSKAVQDAANKAHETLG